MSADASNWEYYFVFAISIVTFSCLLFVIIPFLFMPSLRNAKLELIFYLAIATIFTDISYMIKWNLTDGDFLCKVQSFIMVLTETSEYIWGFIIGHFIHHAIQHFTPDESSDDTLSITRRIIYLSLGYLLPLAFTLAAHFLGVLGKAGRWCWLKDNSWTGKGFQIGEYAVTYFSIIMNFYYTIVVVKDLYRESLLDEDEKEKQSKKWVIIKMLRFPFAQIIVLLIATLNRVSFMCTNEYNRVFGSMAIIGMSCQGLLLFFGFGISTGLLRMIKNKITHKNESFVVPVENE